MPDSLTFPIRSDKLSMSASVTAHLASERTPFQQIDVYDTDVFGRVLTLDGHIQLTTFDEKAYHEALVWVPLLNLAAPQSALVVGGGDGGVLRELCRSNLAHIDMVEIDEGVVRLCREHLPTVSAGAFDDPRVNLVIGDAFGFLKNPPRPYDLIVLDSTDVYEEEEGEISEMLFTEEFYRDVLAALTPGGMAVTQADNPVFCPYSLASVLGLFGSVFPASGSYWGLVPSFGGFSAFCWGSRGPRPSPTWNPAWPPLATLSPLRYAAGFGELGF